MIESIVIWTIGWLYTAGTIVNEYRRTRRKTALLRLVPAIVAWPIMLGDYHG